MAETTTTNPPTSDSIAEISATESEFFEQADKLYRGVSVADALSAAETKAESPKAGRAASPAPANSAAGVTADKSGSATPDASAKAKAAIPGPPKANTPVTNPGTADPAGASPQQGGEPSDDIPAADAFDKGPNRPRTQQWRALHTAKDTIQSQLTEARKEVESLKAQAAGAGRNGVLPQEIQEQIKTLTTERDDLMRRVESIAVEKSPRFEAMFKPRIDAALTLAKAVVGPQKSAEIEQLLTMPPSVYRDAEIEGIIEGLKPIAQAKLTQAVAEVDRIGLERQQTAARSGDLYKQWMAEEQANQQRQRQERDTQVNKMFSEVTEEWKDAKLAPEDLDIAKSVFMGNRDLRDIARASMWVAYGPKAAAQALALQKENEALKAELGKLRSVEPGTSNDGRSPESDNDGGTQSTGDYAADVVRLVQKEGLRFG